MWEQQRLGEKQIGINYKLKRELTALLNVTKQHFCTGLLSKL